MPWRNDRDNGFCRGESDPQRKGIEIELRIDRWVGCLNDWKKEGAKAKDDRRFSKVSFPALDSDVMAGLLWHWSSWTDSSFEGMKMVWWIMDDKKVKRQRKQGWEMIEDSNIGSESLHTVYRAPKSPMWWLSQYLNKRNSNKKRIAKRAESRTFGIQGRVHSGF